MIPTRWQPDRAAAPNAWPQPPLLTAIGRGLAGRCPACGKSRLFSGFLRVTDVCANCGAPLGLARADDAPPYFTIFITGHIVVPLLYTVDRMGEPPSVADVRDFHSSHAVPGAWLAPPGQRRHGWIDADPEHAEERSHRMSGDARLRCPAGARDPGWGCAHQSAAVHRGGPRAGGGRSGGGQPFRAADRHRARPGPYALHLSILEGRLIFDIRDANGAPLTAMGLALGPFRRLVKDYQMLVDSHIKAVEEGREAAHPGHRHGPARPAQRRRGTDDPAAGGQNRYRLRHGAPPIHSGLRAARKGFPRDED